MIVDMDFNRKTMIDSHLRSFAKGHITLDEAASQIYSWICDDPRLLQLVPPSSPIVTKLKQYKEDAKRLGIDLIRMHWIGFLRRKNENVTFLLGIDTFGEVTMSVSDSIDANEVYRTAGRLTDWVNVRHRVMQIATKWPGEYIDPHQSGDKFEVRIFARSDVEDKSVSRWVYGNSLPPSEILELFMYIQGMSDSISNSIHASDHGILSAED